MIPKQSSGAAADGGMLDLGDQQLEYRWLGPPPEQAPTIVMLHEGLGCTGLWGDFPQRLQSATGAGIFVFSRAGYGASGDTPLPRPLSYMHQEGQDVLPRLLNAIGLRAGVLAGHSDGASIAAIFAGTHNDARIAGISLIAPHVLVEDCSIRAIQQARISYEQGDLKQRLQRWHSHVDTAFYGWCDAWLNPRFRQWDITEMLPAITCPVQVIQGDADIYGTLLHMQMIESKCTVSVQCKELAGTGHAPHKEEPEKTASAISQFFHECMRNLSQKHA